MFINAQVVGHSVNASQYNGDGGIPRGSVEFVMHSTMLKSFAHSPSRWIKGYTPADSDSKEFGRLYDCLLLTPEQFHQRYIVQPDTYPAPHTHEKVKKGIIHAGDPLPWHASATYCNEWKREALRSGREIATASDVALCRAAAAQLNSDGIIAHFGMCSDKQVMVTAQWKDPRTQFLIPCKCLIDFVPRTDTEFKKTLADLKTSASAAVAAWRAQCERFRYDVQAMFHMDMFNAATGEDRQNWCFIVQENYEPWEPAKRMLSERFKSTGRSFYRRALARYCECLNTGHWPNYDENPQAVQGWTLVEPSDRLIEAEFLAGANYDENPQAVPDPEWVSEEAPVQ